MRLQESCILHILASVIIGIGVSVSQSNQSNCYICRNSNDRSKCPENTKICDTNSPANPYDNSIELEPWDGNYQEVTESPMNFGITPEIFVPNNQDDGIVLNEASTHTNNHNSLNNKHNARNYGHTYPSKYAYLPSLLSSNPFGHKNQQQQQLNLNYIHNLILKPLSSQPSSGLSNLLAHHSAPSKPSGQTHFEPQVQSLDSISTPSNTVTVDSTFNEITCGKQQVSLREPRVVGGNSTYEGEFPWAVSIQRHGNHHCGGVIVGRRWILTAAHCVRNQLVGNLVVRTGGHTLQRSMNSLTSHLERDYLVEQIVMHDDFSKYDNLTASLTKSSANTNNADIALLRLKHKIVWNELVWPVCLPPRDAGNFSGHEAIVIGWGKLNEKSDEFSSDLQKVKLTIIDNNLCQSWFRQAGREMPIDERVLCAGFKNGGKDACHGDSGGPLLSRINGHHVVVGVVSTGIGCARPLLPGLYARVSSYLGWIEGHLAIRSLYV